MTNTAIGTQNWLSVKIAFAIDVFTPHLIPVVSVKIQPRGGGDFTTVSGKENTAKSNFRSKDEVFRRPDGSRPWSIGRTD